MVGADLVEERLVRHDRGPLALPFVKGQGREPMTIGRATGRPGGGGPSRRAMWLRRDHGTVVP